MQFPVPQFTDIEDKIIGGLSFKQFAIVFVATVVTFVAYTVSKNVPVTIGVGILTGLPSLALVFGKLNGRPLYSSAGNFVRFMFGPKIYVYHKEAKSLASDSAPIQIAEAVPTKDNQATAVKIKELNYLLQQQSSEEKDLIARIQENRTT